MKIKYVLLFITTSLLLTLTGPIRADVEVAFFQYRDTDGTILSLEEGGQFYHMTIKTKDGWLEASPFGVRLIDDLKTINPPLALIIKNKNLPQLTDVEYSPYLGIPFDYQFGWFNRDKTYCSKLVANILGIPPYQKKPLKVTSPYRTIQLEEIYGLSPDDLYKILTYEKGFHFQQWQCSALL